MTDPSYALVVNDLFDDLERIIARLEKRNRKLDDKLNRYRNVLPGRKRLITLGRIAGLIEHDADKEQQRMLSAIEVSDVEGSGYDISDQTVLKWMKATDAIREDALFLRRLEWDFEQAIDVVWEPKQARHVWPRP